MDTDNKESGDATEANPTPSSASSSSSTSSTKPAKKVPRRDPPRPSSAPYSWGVVGGFNSEGGGEEGAEEEKTETPTSEAEADNASATQPKKKEVDPKKKKEEPAVPLSYLRCHICHMYKFNNSSNFMDHVRSKKHRRMSSYYQQKIDATLKLLKTQSWLKSQQNIVAMGKQKGRITNCRACECPIKGGQGLHLKLREHSLVNHFTKCFLCKIKFPTRGRLEEHKLTLEHIKAQYNQDTIWREKYMQWQKKQEKKQKATYIPEMTQAFHSTVNEMILENIDTHMSKNKFSIPIYDPARPTGLNLLTKESLFVCTICPRKANPNASKVLEHAKSREHYNNYLAYLKQNEEKGKRKREESAVKENKKKMEKKTEGKGKEEVKKDVEEIKEDVTEEVKEEKKEEEDKKEEQQQEEEEEQGEKEEGKNDTLDDVIKEEEVKQKDKEEDREEENVVDLEQEFGDNVLLSMEEVGEDLEEEEEEEEVTIVQEKDVKAEEPKTEEPSKVTPAKESQDKPTHACNNN